MSVELIDRVVGTDDPELLRMLRSAKKVGSGHEKPSDSEGLAEGDVSDYMATRLARDHPEQYAAVVAGQLTLHAAAVAAGIRRRRISVRTDDVASLVDSLARADADLVRAVHDETGRRLGAP